MIKLFYFHSGLAIIAEKNVDGKGRISWKYPMILQNVIDPTGKPMVALQSAVSFTENIEIIPQNLNPNLLFEDKVTDKMKETYEDTVEKFRIKRAGIEPSPAGLTDKILKLGG